MELLSGPIERLSNENENENENENRGWAYQICGGVWNGNGNGTGASKWDAHKFDTRVQMEMSINFLIDGRM
jgi:hypothetical protein